MEGGGGDVARFHQERADDATQRNQALYVVFKFKDQGKLHSTVTKAMYALKLK